MVGLVGLKFIRVQKITENIAMQGGLDDVFSSEGRGRIFVTHDDGNIIDRLVLDDPGISDLFFLDTKTVGAIGKYFWISNDADKN